MSGDFNPRLQLVFYGFPKLVFSSSWSNDFRQFSCIAAPMSAYVDSYNTTLSSLHRIHWPEILRQTVIATKWRKKLCSSRRKSHALSTVKFQEFTTLHSLFCHYHVHFVLFIQTSLTLLTFFFWIFGNLSRFGFI